MVNNNRTALGERHRCRFVHRAPTATNQTTAATKSACQVCTHGFPFLLILISFTFFTAPCHITLSSTCILFIPVCCDYTHMYVKINMLCTSPIKSSICIHLESAFIMHALKYWRPPRHTTYCLICVGFYLKIYLHIGPLQAQHVGGKNKLSKQKPEVSNWIYSSCLWELNSQHSIGVFLLAAFKRRGEMIQPNTATELPDFRPGRKLPKYIQKWQILIIDLIMMQEAQHIVVSCFPLT